MKKNKTPWPTKAVMQQIYDRHLWGGKDFDFYSGEGSHDPEIIKPFLDAAISFLNSQNEKMTICDLGCGDFNVGKHLLKYSTSYIAVDIVPELIKRNKELYDFENLEFRCLDISKDQLPKADCAILRQVLQHLSNAEIKNISEKLSDYKYLIVTEHHPMGDFIPNKDKIASQGIRLKQHSGVDLLAEPFNLKVKSSEVLNEVILKNKRGRIVTTLYKIR